MEMSNEKIICKWNNEEECYDLEVSDLTATVADYEATVSRILAEANARKTYGDHCAGCSICCGGRLPLTVVDLYRLKFAGLGMSLPLNRWVAEYGVVEKRNGCVDITLRLDEYETCALWNREDGLCSVYQSRPLICRTYICAPLSWRAGELRGQIVNAGEDELVRMLGLVNRSDEPETNEPFSGILDYGGVYLRDICSDRLWRSLTKIGKKIC